jgi:hypothetical protein
MIPSASQPLEFHIARIVAEISCRAMQQRARGAYEISQQHIAKGRLQIAASAQRAAAGLYAAALFKLTQLIEENANADMAAIVLHQLEATLHQLEATLHQLEATLQRTDKLKK